MCRPERFRQRNSFPYCYSTNFLICRVFTIPFEIVCYDGPVHDEKPENTQKILLVLCSAVKRQAV